MNHKQIFFLVILLFLLLPTTGSGNERRFSYTYETSVLPVGAREIEIWNTDRRGRDYFYRRFDQRIEYEFGVAENLMSALYLNYSWKSKDSNEGAPGGILSNTYAISLSNEWKYKLLDRVADPVGFALYGEGTIGPNKSAIEGKLLFDKDVNKFLLAFNLIIEQEWEYGVDNGSTVISEELKTGVSMGIAYHAHQNLSIGLESMLRSVYVSGVVKHSSLFTGPVISYANDYWWVSFTVMPQIYSLNGVTTINGSLDLDEFEKVQSRLLFSFHL